MFCEKCGQAFSHDASFCGKCGNPKPAVAATPAQAAIPETYTFTPTPTTPAKSTKKFWTSWSPSRRGWFVVVMVLTLLAGLNGQNLFQYVTGMITGQVTLSVSKVESIIEQGILAQAGEAVTATCPDPLSGKPGDVRQCTVQDALGQTYVVDITIQNSNGDILWKLRN